MWVLGIETSCDETAAAVADGHGQVKSSVVSSQLALHAPYGGVVPELASRQHLRDLPRVADQAVRESGLAWAQLEGIAATHGPGLMGALLVGLTWAKAAAFARGLPFIGVNHLEGHLQAVAISYPVVPEPWIGLVASGGHTNLYLVTGRQPVSNHAGARLARYRLLASTRDDAVGEAFDKVAKLLGLPYPGGPAIERAAAGHAAGPAAPKAGGGQAVSRVGAEPIRFTLPRMKDGSLAFSYSGLKTAVRYYLQAAAARGETVDPRAVAAAFQETVVADITAKTLQAAARWQARAIVVTGGVAANTRLREGVAAAARAAGLPCLVPDRTWCTDNAAMIAIAGAQHLAAGERSGWDLPAIPYLEL